MVNHLPLAITSPPPCREKAILRTYDATMKSICTDVNTCIFIYIYIDEYARGKYMCVYIYMY